MSFDDLNIPDHAFSGGTGTSYPTLAYSSLVNATVKAGYFVADESDFDEPPEGWKLTEIARGNDPNAMPEPVYVTRKLRCVVLGMRQGYERRAPDGTRHFFPKYTKSDPKLGAYKGRAQLMITLPGDLTEDGEVLQARVLGLNGMVKALSLDNNQSFRRAKDYPPGVLQLWQAWIENFAKEQGLKKRFPLYGMWWVTLAAAKDGKKTLAIPTGHGNFVNPFTLVTEGQDAPSFVGKERFEALMHYRGDVVIDWEKEWAEVSTVEDYSGDVPDVLEDEEDDIPF